MNGAAEAEYGRETRRSGIAENSTVQQWNRREQRGDGKAKSCKAKESRGVEPRSEGTVENRTDVKRLSEDKTREAMALHRSDAQRNGIE